MPLTDGDWCKQNRMVSEKAGEDLFDENSRITSEKVLKYLLDSLRPSYDYILIDCPPSLSMLTINALVAADSVLLPVEAHILSYDDVSEALATVNGVKRKYNTKLKVEGILLTKYQGQTKLGRNTMKLVQDNYGDALNLFSQPIPYAVRLAEQPGYGVSIHELEPFSKASLAYEMAAKELLTNG